MHDEPSGLLHAAARALALTGLRLSYNLAVLLLTAVRALLLAMVGGVGTAAVYAGEHQWLDAARAGTAAIGCAVLLVAYTRAAVWLDPEHLARCSVLSWRRYL